MTVLSRIIEPSEAVPVFTVPTGVPSKAALTPAVAEFAEVAPACVFWSFRFRPLGLRRCGIADEGVASNSNAVIRQKTGFMTRVAPPEFPWTILKREENGVQHQ